MNNLCAHSVRAGNWTLPACDKPHYQDMLPLPHFVRPKKDVLLLDYALRTRKPPLRVTRVHDRKRVYSLCPRAMDWLRQLNGAIAPAQLVRLKSILSYDDELAPSLDAAHFRALAAGLWGSAAFPRFFDGYSSDWHLSVSIKIGPEGRIVTPDVRLERVGPEHIVGQLDGLDFVDAAMEEALRIWGQFCSDAGSWFIDSGICWLAIRGTTASLREQ